MKKQNFIIFFLVMSIALTLTACDSNENPSEPKSLSENDNNNVELEEVDEDNNEETEENIELTEEDDVREIEDIEIDLYYANLEYIESGDENLEKLVPIKKSFDNSQNNIEELIVRELTKDPEDESLATLIRDDLTINNIYKEDSRVIIDFSSENLNGGSLEESFIIDQILNSLFQLDSVNEVEFLIDGEKADSLMGHVSIEEPFTK